jgi:hypothetical protein
MSEATTATPNESIAARAEQAVPSLEDIAAKMAAMRNQTADARPAATGVEETPVAPEGIENDAESVTPEDQLTEVEEADSTVEDTVPEEEVNDDQLTTEDTTDQEIIDFIEFAEENPNAKFRFMRNGKEMVIDARKAAAILGQGGAIHEEARELKIQKAEFDEYVKTKQAQTEGLILAMAFTVEPQIQKSYDEILKTQDYQTQFRQQLANTRDPGQQARIRAAMEQNERYIQQQQASIAQLQPNVEQFKKIRSEQVREVINTNRKNFSDRELKNEYVFNELRDKISKDWSGARTQLVPGVDNIDLISSDEHILSLLRDGLRYREKPKMKSAGSSIAAVTNRRGSSGRDTGRSDQESIQTLREQARKGDRKAADNVLLAQLNKIRAARTRS